MKLGFWRQLIMSTEEKVLNLIRNNSEEKDGVALTSDLRKDLRFDSFGTLMLINAIEEDFGVAIQEADIKETRTVEDVVSLLRSKYHCN